MTILNGYDIYIYIYVCYSEYFIYFILRNYFKNCQQKILFYNFFSSFKKLFLFLNTYLH